MKRPQLAAILLTAALLPLTAATASAAQTTDVDATSCGVSVTWDHDQYLAGDGWHRGHKVNIHWNPCGRKVRARAHCNNFPYGTYYRHGNTVSSTGVSTVYCDGGHSRYGSQGYQDYHGGSWHYHHLFYAG
jgi:hypothetical protein